MSPPRRLAVLRSHLQPDAPAPPTCEAEQDPAPAVEQAARVSISPCASSGGGEGGGGPSAGGVGDGERDSCVFCQIIRGEAPAFKVYEDDVCLCILDSHPLAPGHSLIIPKCHFPSLEATPPPVAPSQL